jgi:hypothetical protein
MELDKSVDNIRRKLGVKPKKPVKPGTHGVPIKLPGAAPASTSFELGLPVGIKFTDKRGKRTGIDRGNFKAVGRKRRSPVAQPVAPEPVAPEPLSPEPLSPEPLSPEPLSPEPLAAEPLAPSQTATEEAIDQSFDSHMEENIRRARTEEGDAPMEPALVEQPKDVQDSSPKKSKKTKKTKKTEEEKPVKKKSTPGRRTLRPDPGTFLDDIPDEMIVINDVTLKDRIPLSEPIEPMASAYYMNNRERFVNFINTLFGDYRQQLVEEEKDITCADISMDRPFSLLTHQKIVRDYINLYTPYRGLLLYHGLGSGKTCSSIAIAEGLKKTNDIIVMTPASLRRNYLEELKKCGDHLYKNKQYWEFISTKDDKSKEDTLSQVLRLPKDEIRKNGGVWMVDATKPSNFKDLSTEDRASLDAQIEIMISNKYQFINYNGLNRKLLDEYTDNGKINPFDNKVVIIDEAHNFVSRIVGKIKKPESLSMQLYEYLLSAKNCRIIMLTGTPMINYPNEIGVLFNILRGYIKTWNISLDISTQSKINKGFFEELFAKHAKIGDIIDYVDYSPSSKILTVTRNPTGFVNEGSLSSYEGVKEDAHGQLDDNNFMKLITVVLNKENIHITPGESGTRIEEFKALPDTKEEFMNLFIEPSDGTMKDANKFKRRILGLASYFPDIVKLLPRYTGEMCVVNVEMSDYQFERYEEARKKEREMEGKKAKPKAKKGNDANDLYDDSASTYKIFSRAFCNFVFPEAIPRPMLQKGETMHDKVDLHLVNVDEERRGLQNDIRTLHETLRESGEEDKAPLKERISQLESEVRALEQDVMDDDQVLETDETLYAAETDLADGATENTPTNKRKSKDMKDYRDRLQTALTELKDGGASYLSKAGLETFSPKFLQILENIQDPTFEGLHLLYSQFRTVEGIEIFSLILNQNGFVQFKVKKDDQDRWYVDIPPADLAKPKYVLYTGKEGDKEKEIVRHIFNSNWNAIPVELQEFIATMPSTIYPSTSRTVDNECDPSKSGKLTRRKGMRMKKGTRKKSPALQMAPAELENPAGNHMGEIIKLFMITASGAEGISLKSVRYVHLTEPYWNPIRLEQVIGRARRICSHEFLPDELNDVVVFLYIMVFSKHQLTNLASQELKIKDKSKIDLQTPITTDQALYEIANIKYEIAVQILKNIKEASIDCLLHNRADSSESLNCFNFGNPSWSQFSYQPSIFNEESDQISRANKETIRWKPRELEIMGKKYIMKNEVTVVEPKGKKQPEDPYNEVYDYQSYIDWKRSDGKTDLILVGKIVRSPGKKAKFQPLIKKKALKK